MGLGPAGAPAERLGGRGARAGACCRSPPPAWWSAIIREKDWREPEIALRGNDGDPYIEREILGTQSLVKIREEKLFQCNFVCFVYHVSHRMQTIVVPACLQQPLNPQLFFVLLFLPSHPHTTQSGAAKGRETIALCVARAWCDRSSRVLSPRREAESNIS